jgi:hypothetical protein
MSETKQSFGPGKWVLIIALGVVLGLTLWTGANALIAAWDKNRKDAEAAKIKAETEREGSEWLRQQSDWQKILLDARIAREHRSMPAGQAPLRRDGTLRSRIESTETYQSRLKEVGPEAITKEMRETLSIEYDVLDSRRNDLHGDDVYWFIDIVNLLKELGVNR